SDQRAPPIIPLDRSAKLHGGDRGILSCAGRAEDRSRFRVGRTEGSGNRTRRVRRLADRRTRRVRPRPSTFVRECGTTDAPMMWRCPRCLGPLVEAANEARCGSCDARYESFAGILDLRLPGATWIDREADRSAARRLLAAPAD